MASEGFIDRTALDRSLSALRTHGSEEQLNEALEQVLSATCHLFSASGAGLMLVDESSALCSVAATNEAAHVLEGRQEQTGHGPCVDALVLDRVTATSHLAEDERWPQLIPEVPEAGVCAVLGIPIRLSGLAVGALNVYRGQAHHWDSSEIAALTSYGAVIEGVLRTALQAHQRSQLAEQLQHALDNRVVIERAVGVIMAREQADPVTAFNQLRTSARSAERKLVDVAQELLLSTYTDRV